MAIMAGMAGCVFGQIRLLIIPFTIKCKKVFVFKKDDLHKINFTGMSSKNYFNFDVSPEVRQTAFKSEVAVVCFSAPYLSLMRLICQHGKMNYELHSPQNVRCRGNQKSGNGQIEDNGFSCWIAASATSQMFENSSFVVHKTTNK